MWSLLREPSCMITFIYQPSVPGGCPPRQHEGCSNVTGDGRGWAAAGSCCDSLSSPARTDSQLLGPVPGALNWGSTHFSDLKQTSKPGALANRRCQHSLACSLGLPTWKPSAAGCLLRTDKGHLHQTRAGIRIVLATGAQRGEEPSPLAQK